MPSLLDRLATKFTVGDGCWEWTASKPRGYGQLMVDGRMRRAHRVVYETFVGPIPEGLVLDHLCCNPSCVRPDHLEPVTQVENVSRGRAGMHNALKTHCPQGHPYDEKNTYLQPGTAGRFRDGRQCRTCRRDRSREWARKSRASRRAA